jgi:hypothetical protein
MPLDAQGAEGGKTEAATITMFLQIKQNTKKILKVPFWE